MTEVRGSRKEKQHGLFAGMKSIPPTCYDVFDFYPLRLSVFPEITLTQMREIYNTNKPARMRSDVIYIYVRVISLYGTTARNRPLLNGTTLNKMATTRVKLGCMVSTRDAANIFNARDRNNFSRIMSNICYRKTRRSSRETSREAADL